MLGAGVVSSIASRTWMFHHEPFDFGSEKLKVPLKLNFPDVASFVTSKGSESALSEGSTSTT